MSVSFWVNEPLISDNVEFPFADDITIPFEKQSEGLEYNPYKITPTGCGANLDQFG